MTQDTPDAVITAQLHPSGFGMSDSNFDSLSVASDGCVYYTLCSHDINTHARVYRLDPKAGAAPVCLGDLGEIVGEAGTRSVPQGKSHSQYYEHEGKLYFSTHYGYYKPSSNKEEPAETPPGYRPYPGGHFVSLDLRTSGFRELAKAPPGEGILAMAMDPPRGRLYGLTWPRGHFIYYDLAEERLTDLGPVSRGGELGDGEEYLCLCRSLAVDPRDGSVYFTNADGDIRQYDHRRDEVSSTGASLKRDIFGHWEVHTPGHQGYNWRKALWHGRMEKFLAVHPKSAFLFSFDPETREVEIIERIAARELRKSGRFEPFRYGYLGLAFGPDGDTLYYLTATYGLRADDGRTVPEVLHLVTYSLPASGGLADHGVVRLEDGRYPTMTQSIVVHRSGRVYAVPWIERAEAKAVRGAGPAQQVDLISFEDPTAAALLPSRRGAASAHGA
jgi:hypothetical protein